MELSNAFTRENLPYLPLAAVGLAKGIYETASPAAKGWSAIGAFVLAFDCLSSQTLSEGFDVALERHSKLTTCLTIYTGLHLLNKLPESIDMYHKATIFAKNIKSR